MTVVRTIVYKSRGHKSMSAWQVRQRMSLSTDVDDLMFRSDHKSVNMTVKRMEENLHLVDIRVDLIERCHEGSLRFGKCVRVLVCRLVVDCVYDIQFFDCASCILRVKNKQLSSLTLCQRGETQMSEVGEVFSEEWWAHYCSGTSINEQIEICVTLGRAKDKWKYWITCEVNDSLTLYEVINHARSILMHDQSMVPPSWIHSQIDVIRLVSRDRAPANQMSTTRIRRLKREIRERDDPILLVTLKTEEKPMYVGGLPNIYTPIDAPETRACSCFLCGDRQTAGTRYKSWNVDATTKAYKAWRKERDFLEKEKKRAINDVDKSKYSTNFVTSQVKKIRRRYRRIQASCLRKHARAYCDRLKSVVSQCGCTFNQTLNDPGRFDRLDPLQVFRNVMEYKQISGDLQSERYILGRLACANVPADPRERSQRMYQVHGIRMCYAAMLAVLAIPYGTAQEKLCV